MKKLSLLIFAMVIAVAAQGAVKVKATRNIDHMKIMKEMPAKQKLEKAGLQKFVQKTNGTQLNAIVTEQPEGEVVKYQRAGDCIYASSGNIYSGTESGIVTMVYGADGKVYIKDILYGMNSGAWVEGTIEGNTLTVPMGQSIYWSDTYQADIVLVWGSTYVYEDTDDDGETGTYIGFNVDPSVTEATYTIDPEAKTISLNGVEQPEPTEGFENYAAYFAAGLSCQWTDDDSFGGYLAENTVFTETSGETPTVITEQPEGDLTTYYRSGACIYNSFFGIGITAVDGKLNVVINGDKAYIQNPLWYHDSSNAWVEGTYDAATGIITVPTGQYISFYETSYYGVQVMWGKTDVIEGDPDEETGEPTYTLTYEALDNENFQFQIDGNKIALLDSKGDMEAEFPNNYVATGLMGMYSDDQSMTCLEFNTEGEVVNLVPAVPADPTADEWYDCGDESGFSKFYFTLPTKDVDGNALDPEYLSFSIFTDNDEIFTFSGDDYSYDLDADESLTEVPYSLYSNAVDFHNYYVYMYRTNENDNPLFKYRIGIQVYYTVNGVKNASNIVYLGEMPNFDPLYILGEVNGKTWAANDGVEMTTEDGVTYKAEVKLRRPENEGIRPMVDEVPGIKYCWFSFTTELAENNDDGGWAYIEPFRIGAVSEPGEDNPNADFRVYKFMFGQPLALTQGDHAFQLEEGDYTLTVNKGEQDMTLVIEGETLTGIEDINVDRKADNTWYNLAGQKLSGKPTAAGIYINNGKKVIIK